MFGRTLHYITLLYTRECIILFTPPSYLYTWQSIYIRTWADYASLLVASLPLGNYCILLGIYKFKHIILHLDHTSLIYANLIGQLEGTKSLSARLVNLVPLSSGHNLFIVHVGYRLLR